MKAEKLKWPLWLRNLNIVLRSLGFFFSVGSKMLLKCQSSGVVCVSTLFTQKCQEDNSE